MKRKIYKKLLSDNIENLSEHYQNMVLGLSDSELKKITPSPKYGSKVYLSRIKSQYYVDSSFE